MKNKEKLPLLSICFSLDELFSPLLDFVLLPFLLSNDFPLYLLVDALLNGKCVCRKVLLHQLKPPTDIKRDNSVCSEESFMKDFRAELRSFSTSGLC